MKFVDEATIRVCAGNGGNGCLSFLREKHRPKGGPDGGDGGYGGSVFLRANSSLNTLSDFRYTRLFRAEHGERGGGHGRSGKNGAELEIDAPLGTVVRDAESGETIGDITQPQQRLLVARGGIRGLGNARFKSSTNRTPRRTTAGKPGDQKILKLELQVLADVGLLGLPNAGKSTLVSAVSHARPKIADYPFTTLHPHLGVVDVGVAASFVMADIPGLIAGARHGAGLGSQFLRHLRRTRILLHIVDIGLGGTRAILDSIHTIERELCDFDTTLSTKERWLVLNKIDLQPTTAMSLGADIQQQLHWQAPFYLISAVSGVGCKQLCADVLQRLTQITSQMTTPMTELMTAPDLVSQTTD